MAGKSRGRTAGFVMSPEHRTKIANSKILNNLIAFAEGDETVTMEPHRVTAAVALLKKILPDLQSLEVQADVTHNTVSHTPMTAEEWAKQHASERVH